MMNPTSVAATMSATGFAEKPRRSISREAIICPSTNAAATAMPKPVMEIGPSAMFSAWCTVASEARSMASKCTISARLRSSRRRELERVERGRAGRRAVQYGGGSERPLHRDLTERVRQGRLRSDRPSAADDLELHGDSGERHAVVAGHANHDIVRERLAGLGRLVVSL